MFRRYADENFNAKNALYVRTDYFPAKNYFRLAAAEPIKYKFTTKDDAAFKFLLKNLFGHDDFRTGQLPILKNIMSRADTIGILPTGTGKSLCYQMPVLLQPGVSIVIVPIISLMQDQNHCLSEWGHDFRISYLRLIPTLRKYCAGACLLGLTATALQAVLEDKAFQSMDRDELTFWADFLSNG